MRRADNLTTFMCRLSEICLNILEPSGLVEAYRGITLPLSFSTMSVSIVVRRPVVGRERVDVGSTCDFRSEGTLNISSTCASEAGCQASVLGHVFFSSFCRLMKS